MSTIFKQKISEDIWSQKYKFTSSRDGVKSDETVEDSWNRVAKACASIYDNPEEYQKIFYNTLHNFKFLPGGRILAGTGTGRDVTLFNCFVMNNIPDSLDGIFDNLKEAVLTMQKGGGIGYDFSTIRPENAPVASVESFASGPISFMKVWNTSCETIMSAGTRRGAMMACLRCDHPDILKFIWAKSPQVDLTKFNKEDFPEDVWKQMIKSGLENFNLSVLVTDKFMKAVEDDADWDLVFEGKVYETVKARFLHDEMTRATYETASPGTLYIDRINKENNLWYIESIVSTNPCGEQPLPPYGACLLGSLGLPMFVKNPFTVKAYIDEKLLIETTKNAVKLLDSVIDISKFPLEKQKEEALAKRRMGIGQTGLADLLFMLGFKYGEPASCTLAEYISNLIAIAAYEQSIELAIEFGPCSVTKTKEQREAFIQSEFMQRMPEHIKEGVLKHGIRNSHLLSVAPVGTNSIYANNFSSGCEPFFDLGYFREYKKEDGTLTKEFVSNYAINEYFAAGHSKDDPWWKDYMVTAQDLIPEDHIEIQAALQKYVDSSISKTINCPADISFINFQEVYHQAFESKLKGCTTYKPNKLLSSVLTTKEEPKEVEPKKVTPPVTEVMERPHSLDGITYKLRWEGEAIYVNFNHITIDGKNIPLEMFINSKNPAHTAWTVALARTVSAVFRRGGDVAFIAEEFKNVFDPKGGSWVDGKYVPSLVALLGQKLITYMETIGYTPTAGKEEVTVLDITESVNSLVPEQCPSCKEFSVVISGGCPVCTSCGHSKCS